MTTTPQLPPAWFRELHDPKQVGELSVQLLAAVEPRSIDVVVTWSGSDLAVLAHEAARRSGWYRATASVDLGLMNIEPLVEAGSRALFLAKPGDHPVPYSAIETMAKGQGWQLVAIAYLIEGQVSATPLSFSITLTKRAS